MSPSGSRELIFDGHNDVLSKLFRAGGLSKAPDFIDGRDGAIDVAKARAGGFAGGFFAVYVPSPTDNPDRRNAERRKPAYDLPLAEPIDLEDATPVAIREIAILLELQRRGALRVCTTVAEIRDAMAAGVIAAIFHIEGAEAIDTDLETLDVFHAAGLRSIGPVWSRTNAFGYGVPFRFPSSPDTGKGLTDHGIRLVRRCDELGIMVDLSHLNAAGFWDVARHSDKPLVATHSNAHALCPHSRNLTDDQLRAIRDSDGMVGLNFAAAFLREDGMTLADVPLETMLRHLDHLMSILGEDRVGLGSDYDGALVPQEITTVADLPKLVRAMQDHGYGEALIGKICRENWFRVLQLTWGS
jgi:membrane dipeptidase